jgi:hypothetical protein
MKRADQHVILLSCGNTPRCVCTSSVSNRAHAVVMSRYRFHSIRCRCFFSFNFDSIRCRFFFKVFFQFDVGIDVSKTKNSVRCRCFLWQKRDVDFDVGNFFQKNSRLQEFAALCRGRCFCLVWLSKAAVLLYLLTEAFYVLCCKSEYSGST